MDVTAARRRLWQDCDLTADVDLDALAARHPDDDDVCSLVALAREVRELTPTLGLPPRRVRRLHAVRRA